MSHETAATAAQKLRELFQDVKVIRLFTVHRKRLASGKIHMEVFYFDSQGCTRLTGYVARALCLIYCDKTQSVIIPNIGWNAEHYLAESLQETLYRLTNSQTITANKL